MSQAFQVVRQAGYGNTYKEKTTHGKVYQYLEEGVIRTEILEIENTGLRKGCRRKRNSKMQKICLPLISTQQRCVMQGGRQESRSWKEKNYTPLSTPSPPFCHKTVIVAENF